MALTQVPRACDMLNEYMREERPSPMHTLYLQMALLSHVAGEVTHFPRFMWHDHPVFEEFIMDGHIIKLSQLRRMHAELLEGCERDLTAHLLGFPLEDFGLKPDSLFDNLNTAPTPGRWLFSDPINPLPKQALIRRLCTLPKDDPRVNQWIVGVIDRQLIWKADTVHAYLKSADGLLDRIGMGVYLTSWPKRGKEFVSVRLKDSPGQSAGLRAFDNCFMLAINNHKTDHPTGLRRLVPMFLHPRWSRILMGFLLVRQHCTELAQTFKSSAVDGFRTMLWASSSGPWTSKHLSSVFQSYTRNVLGPALGVSDLRQMLCFIFDFKIGKEPFEDDELPETASAAVGDYASAHSRQTRERSYGVHVPTLSTVPEPMFRAIRQVCHSCSRNLPPTDNCHCRMP